MSKVQLKTQLKTQIQILREAVMQPPYAFRQGEREEIWEEINRLKEQLRKIEEEDESTNQPIQP